jgi:hypothetical protein
VTGLLNTLYVPYVVRCTLYVIRCWRVPVRTLCTCLYVHCSTGLCCCYFITVAGRLALAQEAELEAVILYVCSCAASLRLQVLLYLLLGAAVALTLNFNSLQGTLLHRDRTRTEPVTGCSSSEHPYITPIPYRLHNLQKTLLFLVSSW